MTLSAGEELSSCRTLQRLRGLPRGRTRLLFPYPRLREGGGVCLAMWPACTKYPGDEELRHSGPVF